MKIFLLLLLASVASAAPEYRTDRILVKPSSNIPGQRIAAEHAALRARVLRQYPRFGGWQVIALPSGLSVENALNRYRRSGLFAKVQPAYIRRIVAEPNDPAFQDGTLWALKNFGQNAGTSNADIHATHAWNIRSNAESVIVAVIDTGVNYNHEDLASNMWVNPCLNCPVGDIVYTNDLHGINAITGTGDPMDDNGHGTHCAGIVGAVGNNATGSVGVAWRVQLMALKFIASNGEGSDDDAIACIEYAIARGADILSNSWGAFDVSPALSDAISAARDAGIIFVVAAGNSGLDIDSNPFIPAAFGQDNIVSVAATDRNDARAGFSNFGKTNVDLGAPGVAIYSTRYSSNNAYDSGNGTSFACPQVAGALALVKAQFPSLTYTQLIERVLSTVDPVTDLIGITVTGGRLNLHKALAPFLLDGAVDSTNYLQSVSGMTLYAAIHGTTLHVSTWSPGTNGANDHFIFVTDQLLPAATTSTPWAKDGSIAVDASKPFLAGESLNHFVGWFNAPASSEAGKSTDNSGQMEGTIDLVAAFGSMPETIYLAAVAYDTADNGGIASQTPAGNGNNNIESNEFIALPIVTLLDNNVDGVYDRLDPSLDFKITGISNSTGNVTLTCATMPGRTYQLQTRDPLTTNSWSDVGAPANAAGQTTLSFADSAGDSNRLYRVKLVP